MKRALPWYCATALVVAIATAGARAPSIDTSVYAGLRWRLVGPFEGGPVTSVTGVDGEPGVYRITVPDGGAFKTIDGGETWAPITPDRLSPPAASEPLKWVDSTDSRRIAKADGQGIAVSLDAGQTWTAWHNQAIARVQHLETSGVFPYWIHATLDGGRTVTVASRSDVAMGTPPAAPAAAARPAVDAPSFSIEGHPVRVACADPERQGLRFAGTDESVYVSFDAGAHWTSLQLNLPRVPIRDLAVHGHDLVAATFGRSVWVLDDISPLRQVGPDSAGEPVILFKPAEAIRARPDPAGTRPVAPETGRAENPSPGVSLDYYLGAAPHGEVRLEVFDAVGRRVHVASSVAAGRQDPWLAITTPLPVTPGEHRIAWNLRLDPPPGHNHKYARLASALADMPPEPDGPMVLPGVYRVTLTVAGRLYTQPLVVRNDPRVGEAASVMQSLRRQFDLALEICDAMAAAHAGYLELARVRSQILPVLAASDPDVAQAAADLDARLADIDGSDWSGLILPDDDAGLELDVVFDKDSDEDPLPPMVAVSLTKDYDDPTTIVGRSFENVGHAPAFALVNAALAALLARIDAADAAPGLGEASEYARERAELASVQAAWKVLKAADLPEFNRELARHHLPPLSLPAAPAGGVRK